MSMNHGFAAAAALTAATVAQGATNNVADNIPTEMRVPLHSVLANDHSADVCMGVVYVYTDIYAQEKRTILMGAGSAPTAKIEFTSELLRIHGPGFEAHVDASAIGGLLHGEFVVIDRNRGELIRCPKPETMQQYPEHLFAAGPSYVEPEPPTLLLEALTQQMPQLD
jgi:hypothetical protein